MVLGLSTSAAIRILRMAAGAQMMATTTTTTTTTGIRTLAGPS